MTEIKLLSDQVHGPRILLDRLLTHLVLRHRALIILSVRSPVQAVACQALSFRPLDMIVVVDQVVGA